MTELLDKAISELKKLPDTQQNEVAMMILKQILPQENEPTMAEITAIVKEVRHSRNPE
jgi:phage-related protein